MNNTSKRMILLTLLTDIENTVTDMSLKKSVSNVYDTVAHTAPEIMDSRWNTIYKLCVNNMNDMNNPKHKLCLELYEQALQNYRDLNRN